jgi:hypothetical protein
VRECGAHHRVRPAPAARRAPATERTEVYIAYDSDRLYFGIYAHYSEPSLVRANRVDRDQIWSDDRVSAGTVFFLGFDTRYRHGDQINSAVFPTDAYMRTNRAIFTKLQYLFRYQS